MLVNVRVVVERMDVAGLREEQLFSIPADLLERDHSEREMSTIALQLLEAFSGAYAELMKSERRLEEGQEAGDDLLPYSERG